MSSKELHTTSQLNVKLLNIKKVIDQRTEQWNKFVLMQNINCRSNYYNSILFLQRQNKMNALCYQKKTKP